MKRISILIISLLLFCSCNRKSIKRIDIDNTINIDNHYYEIKKHINDFLLKFIMNKSRSTMSLIFCNDNHYQIDNLILLNNTNDKCYTTLNKKGSWPGAIADMIRPIYGVKIDSSWYFFIGGSLALPHEYYHYDKYKNLSFEELSYLAHDMRHKHFLIDIGNNQYEVNHEKIDQYITPSNLLGFWPGEPREGDEAWIAVYNRKMNDTLSTEEINKILAAKEKAEVEFVWKPTPKPKKTPIFESKAWKNRHKEN